MMTPQRGGNGRTRGRRAGNEGSRRAIEIAGADLLTQGRMWARRVNLAQQRLREAVDHGADQDVIDERRGVLRRDGGAPAPLRGAATAGEAVGGAPPAPPADGPRRARTEARRVRAGLAGEPDPDPTAPGIARGWRSLPPLLLVGAALWLAVSAAVVALVIAQRM